MPMITDNFRARVWHFHYQSTTW